MRRHITAADTKSSLPRCRASVRDLPYWTAALVTLCPSAVTLGIAAVLSHVHNKVQRKREAPALVTAAAGGIAGADSGKQDRPEISEVPGFLRHLIKGQKDRTAVLGCCTGAKVVDQSAPRKDQQAVSQLPPGNYDQTSSSISDVSMTLQNRKRPSQLAGETGWAQPPVMIKQEAACIKPDPEVPPLPPHQVCADLITEAVCTLVISRKCKCAHLQGACAQHGCYDAPSWVMIPARSRALSSFLHGRHSRSPAVLLCEQ